MSSESEALTEIPHLMSGLSSPVSDEYTKTPASPNSEEDKL